MIRNSERDIDYIHYHDGAGNHREITYVFYRGRMVWELIIGFLFSRNGYSLQSKEGFILKAKDQ